MHAISVIIPTAAEKNINKKISSECLLLLKFLQKLINSNMIKNRLYINSYTMRFTAKYQILSDIILIRLRFIVYIVKNKQDIHIRFLRK